ncbi:MAG: type II toxin-antitoxin system death-on-curing family toxin [Chloroflexi bacterium]|nr:type II toxin-antitoxin system death-on-curing family toxin [Chloroflexota bacterium]
MTAQFLALRFFARYGDELPSYRANLARPEALESALGLTQMPYYRGVFEKAGALLRSMVKNHPFVDGNKRLGLTATFVFLAMNGRLLVVTNEEMVDFAKELAATQMKWRAVARWLRTHTVSLEWGQAGSTPVAYVAERLEPLESRLLMAERVVELAVNLPKYLTALAEEESTGAGR